METQTEPFAPHPTERLAEKRAVLLVNTRSRVGREGCNRAHRALLKGGLRLLDVQPLLRPGRLQEAVSDAVREGASLVVVGGGDGTLSGAAHVLVGTQTALGVVPLGTGNDFARGLGIPVDDVEAACEVILRGQVAEVDVGRCGSRVFLNAASAGLTVEIAQRLSGKMKRRLGPVAYPIAAALAAWRQESFRLTLREGGRELEIDAVQLVVGNGRFQGGGHLIAPEATLNDRQLDVYTVLAPSPDSGFISALRHWGGLFAVGGRLKRGTHLNDPRVLHFRTRELEVDADPVQSINLDGEILGRTPTRFSVEPRALRVLVP